MNSKALGLASSEVEVTNVSTHGLWLLSGEMEVFLSYEDFPWFVDAPLRHVLNVLQPSTGHFHWPDLDVDLSIDTILHPERFPLKARICPATGR